MGKKSIVYFWAPWCGPCKIFGPIFETVALEDKSIDFAKVNADEDKASVEKYRVRGVPTIIFMDGDTEVHRVSGARGLSLFKADIRTAFGFSHGFTQ